MRNVELYIGSTRVDFFKDEAVTLRDSINNVKDISKVFIPFTQTFSLPASDTNNLLFKHYYKFDIDGGYDARFRVDAILKINGVDFQTGSIQLNSVQLKQNIAHSYRVTFFGKTAKLKEVLGNAELAALTDLFQYRFYAETAGGGTDDSGRMFEKGISTFNVLATGVSDANVILPMITLTDYFQYDSSSTITTPNFYDGNFWLDLKSQLKPAIKCLRVIECINSQFGLEIQTADVGTKTSFFGSQVFDELYLWCHREKTPTSPAETIPPKFGLNFSKRLEIKDLTDFVYVGGDPDPIVAGKLPVAQGDSVDIRWAMTKTTPTPSRVKFDVRDRITGELIYTNERMVTNVPVSVYAKNLTSGTLAERIYDLEFKFTIQEGTATFTAGTAQIITNSALLANYTNVLFSLEPYGLIEDLIPKMKILDFLAALFKTFNLVAYTEGTSETIYVQTYDDFMSGGVTRDITKFIDVNKLDVSRPIPFSNIEFEYATAKDQMSKRYISSFSQQFGNLDYSSPERYEGGNFKQKVKFSHMIYINIWDTNNLNFTDYPMGWMVDEQAKTQVPAPLLFFRNEIDTSANPVTATLFNSYIAPSNVSTDKNHTLHFGAEADEITQAVNANGLFNRFYQQFIIQSFKLKGRIIKVDAYLDNNFLLNYRLNDVIRIAGRDYYINSIRTNLTSGKSSLELIVKTLEYLPSVLGINNLILENADNMILENGDNMIGQ